MADNTCDKYTAKDIIDETRVLLGDTTCSIPVKLLLASINTALRRLAREKGLDKIFEYQETLELSSINADGTNSASWYLNCGGAQTFTDIKNLNILDNSSCVLNKVKLCYLPYKEFMQCNFNPEQNVSGEPQNYTLQTMGGKTKLIFDRPIDKPYAVDIYYSASHPRITSINDEIRIPWAYADIVSEMVKILYMQESNDYATSAAFLEQYDYLVAGLRDQLARQHSSLPFRTFRKGW